MNSEHRTRNSEFPVSIETNKYEDQKEKLVVLTSVTFFYFDQPLSLFDNYEI